MPLPVMATPSSLTLPQPAAAGDLATSQRDNRYVAGEAQISDFAESLSQAQGPSDGDQSPSDVRDETASDARDPIADSADTGHEEFESPEAVDVQHSEPASDSVIANAPTAEPLTDAPITQQTTTESGKTDATPNGNAASPLQSTGVAAIGAPAIPGAGAPWLTAVQSLLARPSPVSAPATEVGAPVKPQPQPATSDSKPAVRVFAASESSGAVHRSAGSSPSAGTPPAPLPPQPSARQSRSRDTTQSATSSQWDASTAQAKPNGRAETTDRAVPVQAPLSEHRSAAVRAVEMRLNAHAASSVDDGDGTIRTTPAAGRAAALEQAIRLENATGQSVQSIVDAGADSGHAAGPSITTSVVAGTRSGHADAAAILSMLPRDAEAPADSFASQAIRGLSAMLNQRGGSMTMRLDPPELGAMRIHMTIVGGNVSAEFTAGSQQAQSLLDRHMATLRQSLEGQGLFVERLTVHATPLSSSQHSAARQDADASGQQQQSWNHQHDAAGSESRGRRDHDAPWRQSSSFDASEFSFDSLLEEDEFLASAAGGLAR